MPFCTRWEGGQNGIPVERCHIIQSHTENMMHVLVNICYFYIWGAH